MKRVYRLLHHMVGALGAGLLRRWMGSLRLQIHFEHPASDPRRDDCDGSYIFVHWHEVLLPLVTIWGPCRQYTMISRSQDGDYTTRIAKALGWQVIRGSSSRGAVTALRETLDMLSKNEQAHIAVTADGPRGPRRQPKEGSVYLASKTGMPMIPCGVAFDRPWRARSWDRFALPRPFRRCAILFGSPIAIPSDLDRDQLGAYQRALWEELDRVDAAAHRMLRRDPVAEIKPPPLAKSA